MKKSQRKRMIHGRRILATALAILLAGSGLGTAPQTKAASSIKLQNPRVSEAQGGELDTASGLRNPRVKMRIRDTITFGKYWQEDTNGDGVADQNDEKQPIKWQVLSVKENDVFLLADKVLDIQPYNTEDEPVTWETCSLRRWLNEDFYETAFSEEEQAAITETSVVNEDNAERGTEGGEDTEDKVYLLSRSEVSDPAYGFNGRLEYGDEARKGKATSYVEKLGEEWNDAIEWISEEKCVDWWLRSPGGDHDYFTLASDVGNGGFVAEDGSIVDDSIHCVRPALHLNLSSFSPEKTESEEIAMEESEWDMVELGTWESKPMQWRVLSVKDGDAFLLADLAITYKIYNETQESVTWEKSTLRSWLNEDFYQNTFSDNEKEAIRNVIWENPDNPWYGTVGGNDTPDFISLLSLADVVTKEYGFPTAYRCASKIRTAKNGAENDSDWWLRSPGKDDLHVSGVGSGGNAFYHGFDVDQTYISVRPALHFNVSSSSLTKTGTVTAKEDFAAVDSSDEDTEEPSDPSEGGSTGNPSGGSSSGMPSGSQGQTGTGTGGTENGGTSDGGGTQIQSGSEAKPGKVSSLKVKNNKKKAVTLSWKKVSKAKKYQIQYGQNNKFKKAKTKTTKKVSYKITKLTKKKTYYFRVRAVSADGKKGTWSKTVKVKIKK